MADEYINKKDILNYIDSINVFGYIEIEAEKVIDNINSMKVKTEERPCMKTVKELIEELSEMPQDALVFVEQNGIPKLELGEFPELFSGYTVYKDHVHICTEYLSF